jgi:hypothetical protein
MSDRGKRQIVGKRQTARKPATENLTADVGWDSGGRALGSGWFVGRK